MSSREEPKDDLPKLIKNLEDSFVPMHVIELRTDQLDCVIRTLEFVISDEKARIDIVPTAVEKFAHRQSIASIADALEVFKNVRRQ